MFRSLPRLSSLIGVRDVIFTRFKFSPLCIFPSFIRISPFPIPFLIMTNPTLIVTGASRGIGRSIALLAIERHGANVVGVARSKEALEQLSHHIEHDLQLKNRFKFVVGDVTEESTGAEALAIASKSWSGRVDGLVLNAG